MQIPFVFPKRIHYSDLEVVEGLQHHEESVEEWFYYSTRRYFNDKFNEVFFDKDKKQEIFQTAFIKLWTEIDNKTIFANDGKVWRTDWRGRTAPMVCSLTTFLMSFAKNEYRELVRSTREACVDDFSNVTDACHAGIAEKDETDELRIRIVDNCIANISPACSEILTMFYYQGYSLDEILLLRQEKNSSKNGLKSAKNKCMTTLRQNVMTEFSKYGISV